MYSSLFLFVFYSIALFAESASYSPTGLAIRESMVKGEQLHFTFEDSGSIVFDSMQKNNGRYSDGATRARGPSGYGHILDLVYNQGYVRISKPKGLDTREQTIAFHVMNAGDERGGYYRILSRTGDSFEVAVRGDQSLWYYPGPNGWVNTSIILPLDEWHHIALVRSGEKLDVYLDGILSYTGSMIGTPVGSLTIGCKEGLEYECFSGQLDELRFFNYPLPAGEIVQLSPINPTPTVRIVWPAEGEKFEPSQLRYDEEQESYYLDDVMFIASNLPDNKRSIQFSVNGVNAGAAQLQEASGSGKVNLVVKNAKKGALLLRAEVYNDVCRRSEVPQRGFDTACHQTARITAKPVLVKIV